MSNSAQNLIELQRLAQGGAGALTQHLLRAMASSIITSGVADTCGVQPQGSHAKAAILCDQLLRRLTDTQTLYSDDLGVSPLLQVE